MVVLCRGVSMCGSPAVWPWFLKLRTTEGVIVNINTSSLFLLVGEAQAPLSAEISGPLLAVASQQ